MPSSGLVRILLRSSSLQSAKAAAIDACASTITSALPISSLTLLIMSSLCFFWFPALSSLYASSMRIVFTSALGPFLLIKSVVGARVGLKVAITVISFLQLPQPWPHQSSVQVYPFFHCIPQQMDQL